ncbi:uncharacterized protein LOC130787571 isoform X3 [Actinidia eriantha]|uniref:uncharacterized protein LOC130787571 isoform X3 n=1 Tax=Actinidia eriantha TaxID=165200 RepID=UPI00258F09D5|nr:uncharacterized protein LOC130787571 isoform X3 [Actinidia eriantha]
MSTTGLMVAHGFTSLQIKPCFRSQSFIANLDSCSANPKHKDGSWFGGGLRWRDSDSKRILHCRSMVVYSSVEPGTPPPNSNPNPNSWKSWVLSAIITIILPFFTRKWWPLFKINATVETVEQLTEVIERVAEGVEDLADNVADKLPEGGKLRHAIETVENAAKETVKDAQFVEQIIDKVEEVEQEVESFINDDGSGTAKEATDQKEEKEG